MPRKKTAVEVLPPEETNQSMREVKHKTEWVELRPVEESSEEEGEIFDDDIAEVKPKRKVNSEREELRKKLAKSNITPGSQLKLTIEKYLHSDAVDSQGGMFAETEHCTKYVCAESHITSEDYLDVARKFGAGLYRFTLRMKNQIVTAWDKRISGGMAGTVIQQTNPADPNSPQVIVQMPEGQQQVVTPVDPFKEAERALNLVEKYNRAFGRLQPQAPENPQRSEDELIASAIIKQPAVIETVVESIVKRVGKSNGESDTPWWADLLKDSITTGQLAPTVQGVVKALFPNGLFGGLFPGGQNNGQAQISQTPLQNQQTQQQQVPLLQTQQQGDAGDSQSAPTGSGSTELSEGVQTQAQTQTITPEQHALSRLIQNCQRNVPVQVAYQQLVSYADAIEEQAPDYSIYGYIDLLGSMSTDQVLEFVKALPGGETVIALPHCREWCEGLQKLIQESQEGEE